jgi:hypothetical protein
MIMVNSIGHKLQRIELFFTHNKVDTVCIKEYSDVIMHLGHRLGPFKIGNSYSMEHYLARIFVEEGILKFDERNVINSTAIQKINFLESTNPEPRQIDNMVYVQAIEQLGILNTFFQQDKIPRRDYAQLLSDVNDLIRVRIAKIARLATQPQHLKTRKLLTEEEKILFDNISHAIQEFQEFVPSNIGKKSSEKQK